jgi:hypothetical protein
MSPISTSQGFPLSHGRFEAKHLEKKEDEKLVIGPKGAGEAPKLTISGGAKGPAAKLSIGAEGAKAPSAKLGSAAPAAKDAATAKVDPRLEKVSREFEAIFMRNLLKPLEKAGSVGKEGSVSSGSGVYGSMMVGALADSASQGGGIGLAHLVLEALTRGAAAPKIEK